MLHRSDFRELVRGFPVAIALLLALACTTVAADDAAPKATPQATIRMVTDEALAALSANKEVLRRDPGRIAALVAKIVDPYLDFTLMSEEALGVAWRRADQRQRDRFVRVFHQLLTDDYAEVLKQYSGQTIRVTGMRWEDAEHHRAMVTSRIEAPRTQPTEVDYRMYRTGGRWKVYDVLVEGTSLLINYREAFASELQSESLDTLIARIAKKVAANQAPGSQ